MKKTHNLVAVVGTYKDASGQEKKRYLTIGSAFTRDDGSIALKIEAVPVGQEWNGWVNLYLPRDKSAEGQQAAPHTRASDAPPLEEPFKDDPIPFGD